MLIRQALTEALALQPVSDESIPVRVASTEALGKLTESMMLQAFKESLSDPSWEVRAAAIQTLGKLSERLIIEPLRMALDDQDFSVRSAALHALGTLKGCLPTEDLVSLAQEETNDWITRDAAVTALERAGEYAQARSLRACLDCALETESSL
jgi:HEAT repeat protein